MPPEKKKLTEDSALSTESVKTSNDEKDNMATIPPGLEGLLDRRLKEQTEKFAIYSRSLQSRPNPSWKLLRKVKIFSPISLMI